MNIGKRLSVLLGFGWWVLMALALTTGKQAWGQQSFSTFADPDEEKLELIVGKWTINDRSYLYEYTPDFAKRIDGFAYYHYKISQFPHNTYL
ncbi:MAG: hypothetical protein GY950_04285, partial [bacterium]|nr:hypothetical protein [bacterium]